MTVDTAGLSDSNSSHLVLDPSHHMVVLNSNDALKSISLGVITRSRHRGISTHMYILTCIYCPRSLLRSQQILQYSFLQMLA